MRFRGRSGYGQRSVEESSDRGPRRADRFVDPARNQDVAPRRQRTRFFLGAAMVVASAAGMVALSRNLDRRLPYLVLSARVAAGSTISASDLTTVLLTPGSNVAEIPAVDRATVVGRVASETLFPGTLLAPGELTTRRGLAAGLVLVGLSLTAAEFPAGLEPGDSVVLVDFVDLANDGASVGHSATATALGRGTVFAMASPSGNTDDVDVTVAVPLAIATEASATSASGDLALAELSSGPTPR